jgi:cytochrome b subunit of formate dehydrogenase
LGNIEVMLAVAFVILTLLTFGPSLVLTVLELLQIVIGRHVHGEDRMRRLTVAVLRHPDGRRRLRRFSPLQNTQHWILVVLFATLVVTGFPMKFADRTWSRIVIENMGGLGVARTIHHWAGIALVAGFLAHAVYVAVNAFSRARVIRPDGERVGLIRGVMSLPLFIGPADIKKAGQLLAYLLFLRKDPPTFGRFTIDQKFEYIGVAWGTILLGVTGAMLWGEQIVTHYLSGRAFNIAIIAHTYEAFLAVIHVGILHIANVVLSPTVFPLSRATLTGFTPITRLAEAHSELVEEVARDLNIATPGEVSHV